MDVRGTKSPWKVLIALAIVCGVVVFAAGFLHRRAVVDAVEKQQARSAAVAKGLTKDLAGVDVSKEAKGSDAAKLDKEVDPPTGTEIALFTLDGEPVWSTAGARGVTGDREQISSAAKGYVGRTVDGGDLIVYGPVPSEKKGELAVAAVVTDYQKLLDSASGPLDIARIPLTALGALLFVGGLILFVRGRKAAPAPAAQAKTAGAKQAAPARSRVSGFEPVPVTVADEATEQASAAPEPPPAPEAPAGKRFSFGKKAAKAEAPTPDASPKKGGLFSKKSAESVVAPEPAAPAVDADALQREVAIRQALEDQLEQLRTRMKTQEEQASATIRDLREQLDTAGAPSPELTVGPAEQDMIERLRAMESELTQARQTAGDALGEVATLQQQLAAASAPGPSAGADEAEAKVRDLERQLEEAQRSASESEQRAQSVDAVRAELEVRVAQLSSKTGELEQKASELETRLQEANDGGDAVRAEIATLTAALGAADGRSKELESEVARLRGELGNQMERAQAAEERVASLEADVVAAAHGVRDLQDTAADVTAEEQSESADHMPAPSAFALAAEEAEQAAEVADASVVRDAADGEAVAETESSAPALAETAPELSTAVGGSGEVELSWGGEASQRESMPEVRQTWRPAEDVELHDSVPQPDPTPEPTPEPEPTPVPEPTPEPEPTPVPDPEPTPEPEPTPVPDPEPEPTPEPEPVPEPRVANAAERQVEASDLPSAPSDADRYDDVWAAAFPGQNGSGQNGSHEPEQPTDEEHVSSSNGHEVLDAEPAAASEPTTEEVDPEAETETVSVDDDLWALRARLARADEAASEPRQTPPAPSWS
jgi:hypothetical protein